MARGKVDMILQCMSNKSVVLPRKVQKYAFTQDESGEVDLTVGKRYVAYGKKTKSNQSYYLVLTDTINTKTPWWMPAQLFDIVHDNNEGVSKLWTKRTRGKIFKEHVHAPKEYFGNELSIEDGEEEGRLAFQKIREYHHNDELVVEQFNYALDYKKEVKLSHELGYEHPRFRKKTSK